MEAGKNNKEFEQIKKQWKTFSQTVAYKRFIEYIDLQKQVLTTMASGPMEVYKEVPTSDGKTDIQLDFEPEKYAYLLQRSVGCDIVKMYVEDFTTSE